MGKLKQVIKPRKCDLCGATLAINSPGLKTHARQCYKVKRAK